MSTHVKHRNRSWSATLPLDGLLSLLTTTLISAIHIITDVMIGKWQGWNQQMLTIAGVVFIGALLICLLNRITWRDEQNLTARIVISLTVMVSVVGLYYVWHAISSKPPEWHVVIVTALAFSFGLRWAITRVWETWLRKHNKNN